MKFDPIRRVLYTDTGEVIKKLECRFALVAGDILPTTDDGLSRCKRCDQAIVDTNSFSDAEVLTMLRSEPDTCLKVDLNQSNLKVVIGRA